jgi:hypothetical protein
MGILTFLVSLRPFYDKITICSQNNDDMLHVSGPSELKKRGKAVISGKNGIYNVVATI